MPTATGTWRLSIGGLWLTTPCCDVPDFSPLLTGFGVRGSNPKVPYKPGSRARAPMYDEVTKSIGLIVRGDLDSDGGAQEPTLGIVTNLDEIKKALRPRMVDADMQLRFRLSDTTVRTAQVQVRWPLDINVFAPGQARVVLDVTFPGGVLYSEDEVTETLTTSGAHVVNHPGTADQFAATVTFAGANKITNADFGGAYLEYTGSTAITVDTFNKRAWYADNSDAAAEIAWGNSPFWLPLAPGDNDLTLTTGADVSVSFFPAYA